MKTLRDPLNIEALEDAGLLSRHAVQNEIAASEGGEHKTESRLLLSDSGRLQPLCHQQWADEQRRRRQRHRQAQLQRKEQQLIE
jgi:hypothetical protein